MSEPNTIGNGHRAPGPFIEIRVHPLSGEINLQTNMGQPVMFYGALEVAKETYRRFQEQADKKLVQVPGMNVAL